MLPLARASRRSSVCCLFAFVGGATVILLPVGLRNSYIGGEWSISTFQAGPNFFIGNQEGADGFYKPLVRGHETPEIERQDAALLAEDQLGRTLSPREVSRYWFDRGLSDVRKDPSRSIRLLARKVWLCCHRYEVPDVESISVYANHSRLLRGLFSIWYFGILAPLAVFGFYELRRKYRVYWVHWALIFTTIVSVALFFVLARYRFPLVPLLIPFAAVVRIWECIRRAEISALAAPTLLAFAAAIVTHWPLAERPRLEAMSWMNVGVTLAQSGDVEAASGYFQHAVGVFPESPEAQNNLAQSLAVGGDFTAAINHYQRALSLAPELMGVDYNLGVALESTGQLEQALSHYQQALAADPVDVQARRAIERIQLLMRK